MSVIKISPKHGLNPVTTKCWFCGKDKGIVLFGKYDKEDSKAPENTVLDYEPCDECKEHFKQGVLLVETVTEPIVDNQMAIVDGLYPTGKWYLVEDKFIRDTVTDEKLANDILSERKAFVEPGIFPEGIN